MKESPLIGEYERLGVTMVERDGASVPSVFRNQDWEYRAVRGAAGVIDLSARARFRVSGSEAIAFLNGLITNDMKTLEELHWMPAVFPNVQGRLLASVRVIKLTDDFLIDTEPGTQDIVEKTLNRFTLAGDFHLTNLTDETALLSVQGKDAAQVVGEVLGEAATRIGKSEATRAAWMDTDATVIRATHTAEEGFDILLDARSSASLWEALQQAGAQPVGFDAFEVLRIEAGVPRYGTDMDENNVVVETNLDDAVSYTKGCYIGQEIIARIKYRGHVAKKLTGLVFDQGVKISRGSRVLTRDDKEIGRLTSVTESPTLSRTIAMGYVKYDYLAPGTQVKVVSEEADFEATVCELPFVHGSWYEN